MPSRFLAYVFRFPTAAAEVEARLLIVAEGGYERWQRSFAGMPFSTLQWRDGDFIVERWGWIEIRFEPHVEDGCLRYQQKDAFLHAGPFCLRLPRWFAPRVEAHESALSAQSVRVTVRITFPVVGLLLDYEGMVEVA